MSEKKNRIFRACDHCRSIKVKCSGEQPCATCRHHSSPCVFSPPKKRGPHSKYEPTDRIVFVDQFGHIMDNEEERSKQNNKTEMNNKVKETNILFNNTSASPGTNACSQNKYEVKTNSNFGVKKPKANFNVKGEAYGSDSEINTSRKSEDKKKRSRSPGEKDVQDYYKGYNEELTENQNEVEEENEDEAQNQTERQVEEVEEVEEIRRDDYTQFDSESERKETSLCVTMVSSKYCELLQVFSCKFFQKEKQCFYSVMGSFFAFDNMDARTSGILSAVTRSIPGEDKLADQYLQICASKIDVHLTNQTLDEGTLMMDAAAVSSIAISFASVNQKLFKHYSLYAKSMFENVLSTTKNPAYWFSAPITILRVAEYTQPKRLLILEVIADLKSKAVSEPQISRMRSLERDMFHSELYYPPVQVDDPSWNELFRIFDYLQKLNFIRKVLFSYSKSLWNIFYADEIHEYDGVVEPGSIPNSICLYLLSLLDQCSESPVFWASSAMFADLHPSFLRFFIFQSVGDDLLSYSEAIKCIRNVFTAGQVVLFPGLGALASLHVVTRFFIVNDHESEAKEGLSLFKQISGYSLSHRYLEVLNGLREVYMGPPSNAESTEHHVSALFEMF